MKRILCISLFLIFTINSAFTPGYDSQKVDTNAKIKAVYIYNFAKYIEWPSDSKSGMFTIGILGDNDAIYNELNKMSKVKKVSNQSFSIKRFASINDVNSPNILYIQNASSTKLNQAVSKLKGKSTLIVTEKPGLARQGSAINFILEGSKQKFELNKSITESHNLKVASTLENLAVLVK